MTPSPNRKYGCHSRKKHKTTWKTLAATRFIPPRGANDRGLTTGENTTEDKNARENLLSWRCATQPTTGGLIQWDNDDQGRIPLSHPSRRALSWPCSRVHPSCRRERRQREGIVQLRRCCPSPANMHHRPNLRDTSANHPPTRRRISRGSPAEL